MARPYEWWISCDESGVGGSTHYGFGSLWMPWDRRGDFAAMFEELRLEHGYVNECKWHSVKERSIAFCLDLVDRFFKHPWLAFHCLVCRRADIDRSKHAGDWDLARRKHFTMLITNKVRRCMRHPRRRGRVQSFRVWVDPIASRYAKADEVVEIIANHSIAAAVGGVRPIDRVFTHDSHGAPSIQLCDLLLGAVMDAILQKATSPAKLELQRHIATHLGWPDLRAGTFQSARKFNIWYFYDRARGPREVMARPLKLKHELPP